jgi:hypothetical protein
MEIPETVTLSYFAKNDEVDFVSDIDCYDDLYRLTLNFYQKTFNFIDGGNQTIDGEYAGTFEFTDDNLILHY